MTDIKLPDELEAIKRRGYVVWAGDAPSAMLAERFEGGSMRVGGIRHVRIWGLQVDDERELPGHERTSIPDEELWQVELIAEDGSRYEVNATLVKPAPEIR
ncbi:MAG: hypothetical protein KJO54_00875 [Gammaproteobacteria bacterium]|nr:hypothetical protein [Gammaproteobacteria bacterium]NNF59735.1 hypothetical protein [Gammaproteobacteria bacterium]